VHLKDVDEQLSRKTPKVLLISNFKIYQTIGNLF